MTRSCVAAWQNDDFWQKHTKCGKEWENGRDGRVMGGGAGGWVDQHAAFLIGRGIKTLDLRVRRQNETAMKLAIVLEAHPKVRGKSVSGRAESRDSRAERRVISFGGCKAGFRFFVSPTLAIESNQGCEADGCRGVAGMRDSILHLALAPGGCILEEWSLFVGLPA